MVTAEEFLNEYGWIIIFGTIILFTGLTMLYYSKKDIYDPEPAGRLIWAFILGIFSVIPALILSVIGGLVVGGNELLMGILVAPIAEEIAKLWFVIYLARSDTFDGPLDGLVYGAMVGAGFAAVENLLYGFSAVLQGGVISGVALTAFRSLPQIIGHPFYTGLAGVGVGEWKVGLAKGKYGKIWRAMLFHGMWNLAASLWTFTLLITGLVIVAGINIYVLRKELKRALALDKDAYDRGYYDQKKKMMELKKQRIKEQVNQSATWSPHEPQPWNTPQRNTQNMQGPQGPQGQQNSSGWNTPQSSQPGQGSIPSWNTQASTPASRPINIDQTVPPRDPAPKKVPNFCKNCGNKRQEGDVFCRNCGFKMVQ